MKKSELLENMNSMGYPLFETTNTPDTNKILAEVIKSKELRFWEGFPVLAANSMRKGEFDYKTILKYLRDNNDKNILNYLLIISLLTFEKNKLYFPEADKYFSRSVNLNRNIYKEFSRKMAHNKTLLVGSKTISTERVLNTFNNYFRDLYNSTNDYFKVKDNHDFEYAMSQVFAKKQKIIFMKKINNEKMTKTENEYYSRVIKKKVFAIANKRLHEMAVRLLMK